jgi:hypothetical protein
MLVRRLPMLLLAAGGIIFAVIRWKLHPRVSLLTVIALLIFLIDVFVYSIVLYYLPDLLRPTLTSAKMINWLYFFIYFFDDFVYALVIILLVTAAFSQRKSVPAGANA